MFEFFLSACRSQGNTDSLKTLTSSFSRSTVLLLFFLMTASHLSLLAKAPAIVCSIKPLFFLLLFKSLISQGPFQCYLSASDLYCHSIQYVQKATAQEVYLFICIFRRMYDKSVLKGKGNMLVQNPEREGWLTETNRHNF